MRIRALFSVGEVGHFAPTLKRKLDMAKAKTEARNLRTALLFFPEGQATVGGYYRDEEGTEYRVSGQVGDGEVSFNIVDRSTAEVLGNCRYRAYKAPKEGAPIAGGDLSFNGESYAVCVVTTHYSDGTTGHSVFPDKMPKRGNAPF